MAGYVPTRKGGRAANPIAAKRSASRAQVVKIERPKNKTEDEVKITRASNGAIIGLDFPDNRSFQNLSNEQSQELLREWNTSDKKKYDEVQNKIREEENKKKAEQMTSQLGEVNTEEEKFINQDIEADINTKITGAQRTEELAENIGKFNPILGAAVKITPDMANSGAGNFLGIKKLMLGIIRDNEEMNNYLSQYNTAEEFTKINNDIINSDAEIETAKLLAQNPATLKQAQDLYNHAITSKSKDYALLKKLSQTNQEGYVTEYRDAMTKIQSYFDKQKLSDDEIIRGFAYNSVMNSFNDGGVQ
jgi:hypothetical protein